MGFILASSKLRSSEFSYGEPLTGVSVCPWANALIFSVPQGKATGGGSQKQQNCTKMIRCHFQIWFNSKNKTK